MLRRPVEIAIETRFVLLVEDRLAKILTERFSIPMDDESVQSFLRQVLPESYSAESVQQLQETGGLVLNAAARVIEDGEDPGQVFEQEALADQVPGMTLDLWLEAVGSEEMAERVVNRDNIIEGVEHELFEASMDSARYVYLTRSLRTAICSEPEVAATIDSRLEQLIPDHQTRGGVGSLNQGVRNYQCGVAMNDYLSNLLSAEVQVNDPRLQDYEKGISLFNRLPPGGSG